MIHKVWQYSFTTVRKPRLQEGENDSGGTGLYMVRSAIRIRMLCRSYEASEVSPHPFSGCDSKNKTAYTSVCRQGDALNALRAEPTPKAMLVGGKYAPHIPLGWENRNRPIIFGPPKTD
eukprot:1188389-Prorocentrum_minimum.AAC.3